MFKAFEEIMENFKPFSNLSLNEPGYAPWLRSNDGKVYCTTVRSIGINPEDMKIVLENHVVKVEGATNFNGTEYSVDFDIPLSDTFYDKIDHIEHETLNGLTYITITLKD